MPRSAIKKADAEKAIRALCGKWADEKGFNPLDYGTPDFHPSYYQFKSWAKSKGYGHYWHFRSTMGAEYDAEVWFDDEFKQMWQR